MERGPALPQTKTVFEMVAEHREQVRRDGTAIPAWVEEVLATYDEAAARFLASGLDIVPCHNDPNLHNFMLSTVKPPKPMKLVDYDYASNNERAYEIGVFIGLQFLRPRADAAGDRILLRALRSQLWARDTGDAGSSLTSSGASGRLPTRAPGRATSTTTSTASGT